MIRHDHVCTDPRTTRRTSLSETHKSFVNCCRREDFATVLRASGDEVNREAYEHQIEPTETALPNFGAHRAPLQEVTLTVSVCYEDFGRVWVNAAARVSKQLKPRLQGWKREMRRLARVKERAFPTLLAKETMSRSEMATDSGWGLGWEKG
jgi:hypothetical protein